MNKMKPEPLKDKTLNVWTIDEISNIANRINIQDKWFNIEDIKSACEYLKLRLEEEFPDKKSSMFSFKLLRNKIIEEAFKDIYTKEAKSKDSEEGEK